MKQRLQELLSEAGESFDYLKSDIRHLGRYLAELEELLESYRTFAATATLSTPADRAVLRKLLKKTQKVIGPPPDASVQEDQRLASGNHACVELLPPAEESALDCIQLTWGDLGLRHRG